MNRRTFLFTASVAAAGAVLPAPTFPRLYNETLYFADARGLWVLRDPSGALFLGD